MRKNKIRNTGNLLAALLGLLMLGPSVMAQNLTALNSSSVLYPSLKDDTTATSLPFILDHNRMMVEVTFLKPDGSFRKASAWVDTGSEFLILAERLGRDLGLEMAGLKPGTLSVTTTSPAPVMYLGEMALNAKGIKTRIQAGNQVRPGVLAEATLPASILRHYHVVFDYPLQCITIAKPGVLTPRGEATPCRVNEETGLFLVTGMVDGDAVALGVDNGSAGVWVSDSLISRWKKRRPEWRQAIGAVGSANFFGFPFEAQGTLMRLPEFRLGALTIRDIALLGLDQSLFEWYSKKSAAPVLGFIGANVLQRFRLEIDFPNQMSYWLAGSVAPSPDLDIVGLTLRPEADTSYTIIGVAVKDGKPAVEGVQSGDKLVRIDRMTIIHAPMGKVVNALRGNVGASRVLVIDRCGKQHTIKARVVRFP